MTSSLLILLPAAFLGGNGSNITTNAVEIHEIFVKKQNQFSIKFFLNILLFPF